MWKDYEVRLSAKKNLDYPVYRRSIKVDGLEIRSKEDEVFMRK